MSVAMDTEEGRRTRIREGQIASFLTYHWRLDDFDHTPNKERDDFDLYRDGELVAVCEVKTRPTLSFEALKGFGTLVVDNSKACHLALRSQGERVHAFVVAETCDNVLAYWHLMDDAGRAKMMWSAGYGNMPVQTFLHEGEKPRRERELLAHLSTSYMRTIPKWQTYQANLPR